MVKVLHYAKILRNKPYLCTLFYMASRIVRDYFLFQYYSMTSFQETGLNPELLRAAEEMGFLKPTPIQEEIIPLVLQSENDLIGLAQTGTGKTAAFGMPLLQLTDAQQNYPQVIILSPTRELCVQIAKDLKNYARFIPEIRIAAIYGGAGIEEQIKTLKKGVQIVAGTPGRVLDLIRRNVLRIDRIRYLVLDEADEMLSMGFKDDIDAILESTPAERRTLLFSATMPDEALRITRQYMRQPQKVEMAKRNAVAGNIQHHYYMVLARHKYLALKRICDIYPKIYGIVFCQTRTETKEIAEKLIADGYNADALHGDLSQAQRDLVMHRFRSRTLQILVATDVAARGLDVDDVTHIINYTLPMESEIYIHRSGRTARAGKSGISISIIHTRESMKLKQIERFTGLKFAYQTVPTGDEICAKQLFNLIDKLEKAEVDETRIEQFLPVIYAKLSWLSREELIKRFVAEEFNRFSNYYKDAVNINHDPTVKENRQGQQDNPRRKDRKGGEVEEGFTRVVIRLGYANRMNPNLLIRLINKESGLRDATIGHIEITNQKTFFEIQTPFAAMAVDSLNARDFDGEPIEAYISNESFDNGASRKKGKKPARPFTGRRGKKDKKW